MIEQVRLRHDIRRAWCFLTHRPLTLLETNEPPQRVCRRCGVWRYPGEEDRTRQHARRVVVAALVGLIVGLVQAGCVEPLQTAPSATPQAHEGRQASSGKFDGGSVQR